MKKDRIYAAIDLKSFYASVECVERGLDPLTTNLVVADRSRTSKTICLAVSPSLKAYGIPGRARLFEVEQRAKECGGIEFIAAVPQMALYMEYSRRIYQVYLKYVAPEDIHVYSIDEVFMDLTDYLGLYNMTPKQLVSKMIRDVFDTTGITAAGGIGTNLYLCKVAMDIMAKHAEPDEYGVRIAYLDTESFRKNLWTHRPLTDFWRIGRGTAKKLEAKGLYTMGDIARCSLGGENDYYNEELLFGIFGIAAEFLIDHAWGFEDCTIAAIHAYKPENSSVCQGQVLSGPYTYEKTELVIKEMCDLLALDLVGKNMVADQIVLTVGYDIENLSDPEIRKKYKGPVSADFYGRTVPKPAHGSVTLKEHTSSTRLLTEATLDIFRRTVNPDLLVRRLYVTANRVIPKTEADRKKTEGFHQMDLFTDFLDGEAEKKEKESKEKVLLKENKMQQAMLDIKNKFGKNAILKGMNLEEGGTTINRNRQIGGHKA